MENLKPPQMCLQFTDCTQSATKLAATCFDLGTNVTSLIELYPEPAGCSLIAVIRYVRLGEFVTMWATTRSQSMFSGAVVLFG